MDKSSLQFFISYSHKDVRIKEKLIVALNMLKYEFNIRQIWHDGEITSGSVIDKDVLKNINNSDVILLLISVNFLSSCYCMKIELEEAIKRMNKGECIVIPVILSECTISENLSFYNLKRLPIDGRPICSRRFFQNQNNGCVEVVNELKKDLKKIFPNTIIRKQHKKGSQKNEKNNTYIELYKDGRLQYISVSQNLISQIPKCHRDINNFRTMMEQALNHAKKIYASDYKSSNRKLSNDVKLKLFRSFLMHICSYTKKCITDSVGIKVHFRISKDDKYLGLIASTDEDDLDDLSSNWTVLMTAIPIYEGLIYHSYRLRAPLLKSLNLHLNSKGKNDKIWKDYVTFTFPKFHSGQIPLISYCISVNKDYYSVKSDTLKILAYLNLGDIIEKFIVDYYEGCKKIDKTYDLEEIIKSI